MRLAPTLAAAFGLLLPLAATASTFEVNEASLMIAPTHNAAALLMQIQNTGAEDDRLVRVDADGIASRISLHTHVADADGTVRMISAEDGIALSAGSTHVWGRMGDHSLGHDGDHSLMMELATVPEAGTAVPVTLVFASGTEVTVEVPVALHPTQAGLN